MGWRRGVRRVLGAGAVLAMVVGLQAPGQAQVAEVLLVTSNGDEVGLQRGDGICDPCTLREAIETANELPGVQVIEFAVRGPIRPQSELQVDFPVVIDGTTHPDYAGTPVVELDGSAMSGGSGLNIGPSAAGTTIRGLAIHSFPGSGIDLIHDGRVPAAPSLIEDNHIGTDPSGTRALPNATGLYVAGRDGGQVGLVTGNVLSGNMTSGVSVAGDGQGLRIADNHIGTDAAGTAALGNGDSGVRLGAADGVVVTGNLISGNGGAEGRDLDAGVLINKAEGAPPNVVQGNRIGTDAAGAAPLPNGGDGVHVRGGEDNLIGGTEPGQGNVIAFNGRNGVCVSFAQQARVSGNAISGNGLLGIDLNESGGGCTGTVAPNDPGDEPAPAGNALQNYPVLQGTTGTLDSQPSRAYRVELFSNDTCDPSGHGEGQRFVQALDVTTDAAGAASFALPSAGGVLTATATSPEGNTSEFSACAGSGVAGDVERVGGTSADVRDIAVSISQQLFNDASEASPRALPVSDDAARPLSHGVQARSVLLARNDVFADALAGAPLAGPDSPILFTTGGSTAALDPQVRAEIDRVLPAGGKVVILGGDNAVSPAVQTELEGAGYEVQRLFGGSRFDTAAAIAREVLGANPGKVEAMLAFGGNFPDAVTGGAFGAETATPILLTETGSLHPATRAILDEFGISKTFVLGGTTVISDAVAAQTPGHERIAGPNRMATAAEVARVLWGATSKNAVVVNLERPDAWAVSLAAAVLSARFDGAQIGVGVDRLPEESQGYLASLASGGKAFIVGPVEFISTGVESEVASRLPG